MEKDQEMPVGKTIEEMTGVEIEQELTKQGVELPERWKLYKDDQKKHTLQRFRNGEYPTNGSKEEMEEFWTRD